MTRSSRSIPLPRDSAATGQPAEPSIELSPGSGPNDSGAIFSETDYRNKLRPDIRKNFLQLKVPFGHRGDSVRIQNHWTQSSLPVTFPFCLLSMTPRVTISFKRHAMAPTVAEKTYITTRCLYVFFSLSYSQR